MFRTSTILALVLVLGGVARAGDVFVVDKTGAGDFIALQSAIDAAASGDTLVVRSVDDVFTNVIIDGKELTIVGEGDHPRIFTARIRNLPAGAAVTIRNLEINGDTLLVKPFPFIQTMGLWLQDNDGSVWVEDCTIRGGRGFTGGVPYDGQPAVRVQDCAAVTIVRCDLTAGFGATEFDDGFFFYPSTLGGDGLSVVNGFVSLSHGEVHGGRGGNGAGKRGGHGALMAGGQLFLTSVRLTGGNSGGGCTGSCTGSDGLHQDGGVTWHLATDFTPGVPPAGSPSGEDVDVDGGVVVPLAATPRSVEITEAPVISDEFATMRVDAVQGDLVGFFVAVDSLMIPLPGNDGAWSLFPPFFGLYGFFGVTDPSGVLTLDFRVPDIAPATEGLTVYIQGVIVHDGGMQLASTPTSMIMLASTP